VFYFTLPEMGEHPQAGTTAELPLSALRL
jgi:hypothetical protein